MIAIPILIFLVLVLGAAAFVSVPVLRQQELAARWALAGAATLLVLGVGVGAYLQIGAPRLALRSAEDLNDKDPAALVARLAVEIRKVPNDPIAWMLLARGYRSLGDPASAAAAYQRAIALAPPPMKAMLYGEYGETVARASGNVVTPEAEAAFNAALAIDPTDMRARFFLGFAYAARGENTKAQALWEGLLAQVPQNSPLHNILVDRIAGLRAQDGAVAPDPRAMVGGLAARLKENPNDPQGWQRLVRAYGVLGEKDKQRAALAEARRALKNDPAALAKVEAEAK